MFRLISGQSSSVLSRFCPRYLKVANPSTSASPSTPYRLNYIYMYLFAISTHPCMIRISIPLFNISVRLCLTRPAAGICIPQ